MPEAKEADTTEFDSKVKSPRRAVNIEFAAISDPGRVRANNEDHYLITRMSRTYRALRTNMPEGELPSAVDDVAYAMVVADGMGGHSAGEKASQLAIRTGVELVLD